MVLEGDWVRVVSPVGEVVRELPKSVSVNWLLWVSAYQPCASPVNRNIRNMWIQTLSNPVCLAFWEDDVAGAAAFVECVKDVGDIVLLVS